MRGVARAGSHQEPQVFVWPTTSDRPPPRSAAATSGRPLINDRPSPSSRPGELRLGRRRHQFRGHLRRRPADQDTEAILRRGDLRLE
jgi:hypothetical protein